MNEKAGRKRTWSRAAKRLAWVGVVLLAAVVLLAMQERRSTTLRLAKETSGSLRTQCSRFDTLMVVSQTKSLFRTVNSLQSVSARVADEPESVTDELLQECVDNMRLSGIVLLDGNMNVEAQAYAKRFRGGEWAPPADQVRFQDIVDHPEKVTAERIERDGEYYDVCAVARQDAPGILVAFFQQPSGLISNAQDDLESLLPNSTLEGEGQYAVVKDGMVRAASDETLRGLKVEDSDVLLRLEQIPQDGALHSAGLDGLQYEGYHTEYGSYQIYVYYPVAEIQRSVLAVAAVFTAIYLVLCLLYNDVRSRALYENHRQLQESNEKLTETVNMLRALETLYFSLFYVDIESDGYRTIYLAPWLTGRVPQEGTFTELKNLFTGDMVAPEYKESIYEGMSAGHIRKTLGRKADGTHRSFYLDYQALRGEEHRWCRVTVAAVDYNGEGLPLHVLALLQDVDNEKRKEAAYQEQILAEVEEARAANNAKSEFLSRMSHDIRTPMNAVINLTRMARQEEDLTVVRQYLDRIDASGDFLLGLINDILDMSKIENGELTLHEEPLSKEEFVTSVDAIMRPLMEAKDIRFHCEVTGGDELILVDKLRFNQIFFNLLSNAAKFTPSGGDVWFTLENMPVDHGILGMRFTVRDNGIGMSEEFLQHLYDPFAQEHSQLSADTKGTGLGLPIVKSLVEAMGGTIDVRSRLGEGTEFTVVLYARLAESQEDRQGETAPVDLTGARILLVEDNEINVYVAKLLLEEKGCLVTVAKNGQEAVDEFDRSETGRFDAILMDVRMPVMDGIEATRRIRALPRPDAAAVPIIAMTADAFTEERKRTKEAGMNEHLSKPIEPGLLFATLARYIRRTRQSGGAQ